MNKEKSRYYEIDAMRGIALVLLIIYHIFICYQPFAEKFTFLRYEEFLTQYWVVGELLNVWRIPILFVIAGMSVGFVIHRHSPKDVYVDRMVRLVPPLLFTWFVLVPVFPALFNLYHGKPFNYAPFHPGHLWFVQNLVSYTCLILPLIFWFHKQPNNFAVKTIKKTMPIWLFVIIPGALMIETLLLKPAYGFALFMTRFWYGSICYLAGFLLAVAGPHFWYWIRRVCHITLPLAIVCFILRKVTPDWFTAYESCMWIFSFIGYGSLLLRRPNRGFSYLNKAIFPIYIIHMIILQAVAMLIYRWKLPAEFTFTIHVVLTLTLCWLCYEFIIKRIPFCYPVMGIKPKRTGNRYLTFITAYVLAPLVFLSQLLWVMLTIFR